MNSFNTEKRRQKYNVSYYAFQTNTHFYILKSKQERVYFVVISITSLLANDIAGNPGNVCPDYLLCFAQQGISLLLITLNILMAIEWILKW